MTTELVARSTLISYESATVLVSSTNTVLPADIFNPFKDFKLNAVSLYTSIVYTELSSPYSDFTWKFAVINPVWLLKYQDRKSTRLNSSHVRISYAVFCL